MSPEVLKIYVSVHFYARLRFREVVFAFISDYFVNLTDWLLAMRSSAFPSFIF